MVIVIPDKTFDCGLINLAKKSDSASPFSGTLEILRKLHKIETRKKYSYGALYTEVLRKFLITIDYKVKMNTVYYFALLIKSFDVFKISVHMIRLFAHWLRLYSA